MDIYKIILDRWGSPRDIAVFPGSKDTEAFALPYKDFVPGEDDNMDPRYVTLQEWINKQ